MPYSHLDKEEARRYWEQMQRERINASRSKWEERYKVTEEHQRKKMEEYELIRQHMMEYDKQRKEDPHNYCRICGNYMDKTSSFFGKQLDVLRLCESCHAEIIKQSVDAVQKKNPKACPKCLSHINACTCPERKAFKKLKR